MKDVDFNTECAEPEVASVGRTRRKGGTAYTSLKVGDVELSLDNHIYVGTETAGMPRRSVVWSKSTRPRREL